MTKEYLGVQKVTAWEQEKDGQPGYAVKDKDGIISWMPKAKFESIYLCLGTCNVTKIEEPVVEAFIVGYTDQQIDAKTALASVVTLTGFTMYEHSSCVDPKNYDHELGVAQCLLKAKVQAWEKLGFVLQWAENGLSIPTPSALVEMTTP